MDIKHKILVMSGKGGVGKTTVAVNLACGLSDMGFQVGLMDVDLHGPNVPKMMGLGDRKIEVKDGKVIPISYKDNLKVVSMAFLLQHEEDAVIWRGPMKHGVIKQFAEDVAWGKLDYLIVDLPPGTGDEALSVVQVIKDVTGTVIVSTPQEVALLDSKKAITFANKMSVPVLGVVENMSGEVFGEGGAKKAAEQLHTTFLGAIPLDKTIVESGDSGLPFVYKKIGVADEFKKIIKGIIPG